MKKLAYILLACLSFGMIGCDLDTQPWDQESEEIFWGDPNSSAKALVSCYADILDANSYGFMESLSDNAYTKDLSWNSVRDVANGNYDPASPLMQAIWNNRYAGIKRCNNLLSNIDRVPNLDPELKKRQIAQARFIRAFHYFELATFFGDVPFFTHEISIEEATTISRTPKSTVIKFVLDELDAAYAELPLKEELAPTDNGRLTKGAALMEKARVLLSEGNRWAEVVEVCSQIMSGKNGSYSLYSSYGELFDSNHEGNCEVILDIQYMPQKQEHGLLGYLIPPSEGGFAAISPSQELVNDYIMLDGSHPTDAVNSYDEQNPYKNRDPRFAQTLIYDGATWKRADGTLFTIETSGSGTNGIDGPTGTTSTGYYTCKQMDYASRYDNGIKSGLNCIIMRYADVLLMYAEAKNEIGLLSEADWNKSIRLLRERAGFTADAALKYPSGKSQDEIRTIIRRERRAELAMEGLRFYDIKRWKTAEVVLNGWLHGIKQDGNILDNGYKRVDKREFDPQKHYLWPIPQAERDINKNLTQNPNW